mmetsp:Transcript_52997/g.119164  ORF Transcript_52997/g.119164 Transcript_52997/m.119164 type:complete len:210 (-) Transcript_52997:104-733(-)
MLHLPVEGPLVAPRIVLVQLRSLTTTLRHEISHGRNARMRNTLDKQVISFRSLWQLVKVDLSVFVSRQCRVWDDGQHSCWFHIGLQRVHWYISRILEGLLHFASEGIGRQIVGRLPHELLLRTLLSCRESLPLGKNIIREKLQILERKGLTVKGFCLLFQLHLFGGTLPNLVCNLSLELLVMQKRSLRCARTEHLAPSCGVSHSEEQCS